MVFHIQFVCSAPTATGKLEMDDCSKLPLLADALRREGFTEDEVEAIFYRNARRFFEENL